MKPKPFWPLNHLTVPVGIFFSKANIARRSSDSDSTGRCLWEGARGRIQKGTAANRMLACILILAPKYKYPAKSMQGHLLLVATRGRARDSTCQFQESSG